MSREIIVAVMLICLVMPATDVHPVVVDKIVAVVNDEVITQQELTWVLIPMYEQYKKEYTGKRLEDKMIEAEDNVLNQLIEEKLILSEAKRQGVEATKEEIEVKLQEVRNHFETEEEFRDALVRQNVALGELRSRFKDDIIKSKLVKKRIGWKVSITPIEVHKYYDSHIEEFAVPEKVRVQNILIRKGNERRTNEEAGFLIERIKELIDLGKDFKEVVIEYSEGTRAGEGGDLGLIEKGQMMKEIDDAIFTLDVGDVSAIIESPVGFHIFKITEKIPANVVVFEDAENQIEDLIYKKKIDKSLKKWLKELRKDAYISIK